MVCIVGGPNRGLYSLKLAAPVYDGKAARNYIEERRGSCFQTDTMGNIRSHPVAILYIDFPESRSSVPGLARVLFSFQLDFASIHVYFSVVKR